MNVKDVVSQSSLLQEMVRVKKIRFKDIEERKHTSRSNLRKRANFEEFKAVYEDRASWTPTLSHSGEPHDVRKTKSGSLYRFSRAKKDARHVKTVNIELPVHYGADCAVQIIENKIKPKKASRPPKAPRSVLKQPERPKSRDRSRSIENKPKKSVTIVESAMKMFFEENAQNQKPQPQQPQPESVTDIVDRQLKEIQSQLKARKDRIHKTLPKLSVAKPFRKKYGNERIMNSLATIKGKLQKMQEKYFDAPRVQYRTTSDCFTQSGNVEVLFENRKYPEADVGTGDAEPKSNCERMSSYVLNDPKMQERIKEMNEMFPEFPKIEDTIRQIETHLEVIVNMNAEAGSRHDADVPTATTTNPVDVTVEDGLDIEHAWNGGNLNDILNTVSEKHSLKASLTDEILKDQADVKERKLRTIRKQIDEVEEFCDRLSEFANSEQVDLDSVTSELTAITEVTDTHRDYHRHSGSVAEDPKQKHPQSTAVQIEGPDLQKSIKKSHYLSREFSVATDPMIKIFSENRPPFWNRRAREAKRPNDDVSVESVTKMIDTLKFTLENSIYEPVA